MRKIILIGGAPTAGKSYAAKQIADSLKMPWISTDDIREQMRKTSKKEDFKNLFFHSDPSLNAVKYLLKYSADEIVENQNDESADVWKGVKDFIEKNSAGGLIVEGVAVLPSLVKKLKVKNKEIKVVFLMDDNIKRVRKTIFTRGLWDDADKYPDDVKEKEVEWVMAFNKYIEDEAKKYGFNVIKVGNRKDYIEKIKELIK